MRLIDGAPRAAGEDAHASLVYELQWQASHQEPPEQHLLEMTGMPLPMYPNGLYPSRLLTRAAMQIQQLSGSLECSARQRRSSIWCDDRSML